MANIIEGKLITNNEKYCIIVSRFNEFISSKLLSGAIDALVRHGIDNNNIDVLWTPGAFEIPLISKKALKTGKYDAIITLGAIIRGQTAHFEYVASEMSKGIANVGLEMETPITFGVLTTENLEQAIERSGSKAGNKGAEAALAAIEMVNLIKNIK